MVDSQGLDYRHARYSLATAFDAMLEEREALSSLLLICDAGFVEVALSLLSSVEALFIIKGEMPLDPAESAKNHRAFSLLVKQFEKDDVGLLFPLEYRDDPQGLQTQLLMPMSSVVLPAMIRLNERHPILGTEAREELRKLLAEWGYVDQEALLN